MLTGLDLLSEKDTYTEEHWLNVRIDWIEMMIRDAKSGSELEIKARRVWLARKLLRIASQAFRYHQARNMPISVSLMKACQDLGECDLYQEIHAYSKKLEQWLRVRQTNSRRKRRKIPEKPLMSLFLQQSVSAIQIPELAYQEVFELSAESVPKRSRAKSARHA